MLKQIDYRTMTCPRFTHEIRHCRTILDDGSAVLQTVKAMLSGFSRAIINMDRFREEFELPFSILFRNLDMSKNEIELMHGKDGAIFHDTYEARSCCPSLIDIRRGESVIEFFRHSAQPLAQFEYSRQMPPFDRCPLSSTCLSSAWHDAC
ncbi:hypothetical protein GGD66_006546 [Bradyrhizobium sp. CIR48]|uniref:hypothetical protein n=1 Tax=Bradyrhizobium sp. CIR48 TaxID=2663840 RepID=UPI001605919C|nr:hypothetical protein [Bradyrhizobium sp. CIR48]MBB4427960.1 hypothetical protein [Bradyrhizobium sp. CIR48]